MGTITTFPVRASVVNIVDASDEPMTFTLGSAEGTPAGAQVTIVKADNSSNVVSIQDSLGRSMAALEAQDEAVTFFCDGEAWSLIGSTAGAGALATKALEADFQSADGPLQGSEDFKTAVYTPTINWINAPAIGDAAPTKILAFSPGSTAQVNSFSMIGSGSGAGFVTILAAGGDANLDIALQPAGAGKVTDNGVPVAISSQTVVADSVEPLYPTVAEFNDLLALLRTARVLDQ